MNRKIFTYKNYMVDLSKVSIIEFDEDNDSIIFCMDGDWEYEIELDEKEAGTVKRKLVEMFNT